MEELLTYGFLQRAFLAGVFIAASSAVLGIFLVLRRDAMAGHGLSHIAFAGVAVGLVLNVLPLGAALLVTVATALLMNRVVSRSRLHRDTAMGIFSSLGLAAGILLASLARGLNVDLLTYLFGEILAIEPVEVVLSITLAAAVVAAVIAQYPRLQFATFDREAARAAGVRVERMDTLLTVLTAVTVVLGMKVVGLLLVAALLVIPAAAGLQAARTFRGALFVATGTAVGSVVLGLYLALRLDIPASAAIVGLAFLAFAAFSLVRRSKN